MRQRSRVVDAAQLSRGGGALVEQKFFPTMDQHTLTAAIAYYQQLGCWNLPVTIARATYEVVTGVYS
jgi:hypothetical protein